MDSKEGNLEEIKLFAIAPDISGIVRENGYFFEYSNQVQFRLGWKQAELSRLTFYDLVHSKDRTAVRRKFQELSKVGGSTILEFPFISKEGKPVWHSCAISWIDNEKTWFIVARDISKVKEREALLDEMQRIARIGTWSFHVDDSKLRWSAEVCELLKLSESVSYSLEDWRRLHHEEARAVLDRSFTRAIDFAQRFDIELPAVLQSGRILWLRIIGIPIISKRAVIEIRGVIKDITDKKRPELALRENARRFQAVADYTYGWETWFDPFGMPIWINRAVERLTGYSVEECLRMESYPLEIVHPEDRPRIKEILQSAQQGDIGSDQPFRIVDRFGWMKWMEISWQSLYDDEGRCLGFRSSIRDVTEEKQAYDQLAQREQELMSLVSSMEDIIWELDIEGRISNVWCASASALRVWREDCIGQLITKVIPDEAGDTLSKLLERAISTSTVQEEEISFKRFPGRWFRCKATVVRSMTSFNEITRVSLLMSDVTDKRNAEARFRVALEAVQMGIWKWDLRTGELSLDNRTKQLHGVSDYVSSSLEGFLFATVHQGEKDRIQREIQAALGGGRLLDTHYEVALTSGEPRIVALKGTVERDSAGNPQQIVGVCWDVTNATLAKRQIEDQRQQLVHSAKMTSLGEMAAGIAHEINNPLAIINVKTTLLKNLALKNEITPDKFVKDLEKIENTVMRISKIVKGLRTFARGGTGEPCVPYALDSLVGETLEFCREKFRAHQIDLRLPLLSSISIQCRPSQISQVLLNLLNNAFDAVETLPERWVQLTVDEEDDKLIMRVIDSGSGIPHEVVDRLMEPFFSTKEVGRGTGLGLSISKGIIDDHHGRLYYDHKCPNTCFVIELPVVKEKSEVPANA